jgi:hypothetical protein
MAKTGVPLSLLLPPLAAVAVLGFSLTLGANSQSVRAAQIFSGPTDSVLGFRGRIRLVSEREGQLGPVARESMTVTAEEGSKRTSRQLVTDPEGWVEFEFPRNPSAALSLQVQTSDGVILSRGGVSLSTADWAKRARRRGFGEQVLTSGPFALRVHIEGGVLAVPYASIVHLSLFKGPKPASETQLELSAEGGQIQGGYHRSTDSNGTLEIKFTPEEHSAMLSVRVRDVADEWSFQQGLPVVPGAFSLEKRSGQWQVRSPVPRDYAWFTLVTDKQRGPGGRIALEATLEGGSKGTLPALESPLQGGSFLVLSGDATGLSLGTVGIPLSEQGATFDASDLLVIDSLPRNLHLVQAQERRTRFILGVYVFVAGVVTLVLFSLHLRRSEETLSREFLEAGVSSRAKDSSRLPLVFAIVSLFFAFSLAVLWIVAR